MVPNKPLVKLDRERLNGRVPQALQHSRASSLDTNCHTDQR